jgi:motility quorum-sensing regulator / GCU-specific mRNA interferase toxin
MGRGQPTYDLQELQRLIGQGPISSVITQAARDGAFSARMTEDDLVDAVLTLTSADFYKSMESVERPGLWQDVYHLDSHGTWLYIKLQLLRDGRAVVVQFKKK